MSVSIIHDLLELGANSNASDWHIKQGHPVVLRIEKALVDTDYIPDAEKMEKIMQDFIPNKELREKFNETGDLDISYVEDNVGRFRVNVHMQRGEPAFTLRYVKTNILTFDDLGLPEIMQTIAEAPRGIIILGGTTGSGKSTTLAEDKKSVFEQREVGIDTDSFKNALIHALRQDPDIIMVGEMRDRVSFDAALQAADTGHLVMTTLHANTASQAITRILDFYSHQERESVRMALSMNLHSIICQRLLPRAFGGGLIPGSEIMINTPMVRKILEKDQIEKLPAAIDNGREDGMQTFNHSLLQLVNEGLITEEDALATATNPEALRMNLQGIELKSGSNILG